MATKSFDTTLKFNRKSTDSLLNALENIKKPNLEDISNIKIVRSSQDIVNLFKKPATRKEN
ncbi:hypothetical protein [Gemella sanguinis]|jgi:hypothetical protein|uniref:hypothetical protein n=1 Tax=Gemella sanguinis TaxID=84135 RepID=UPI0004E1BB80|nr:hypothetical protein [Gemella sanguinis]NKZ25696.1 hypothetical protein [Gemella sanguinis]